MNLLLSVMRHYILDFVKRRKLRELFVLTASAFQCDTPKLHSLTSYELLDLYARFTAEKAQIFLRDARATEQVRAKLFQNACAWGGMLRQELGLSGRAQAALALHLAYKVLHIDFHLEDRQAHDEHMVFHVSACFFQKYYDTNICRLISALDAGLVAGLMPGAMLQFACRLTEGASSCRGSVVVKEQE